MHFAGSVSGPLIVAISVGAFLVLFVALVWIIRWARRKPSTELPPPRLTTSTYWNHDEEFKNSYNSGNSMPRSFGYGDGTDSSQVSLWRGPNGDYYTTMNDGRLDDTGSWIEVPRPGGSSGMPSPIMTSSPTLQPSPNGSQLPSNSASSSSSALYPRQSIGKEPSYTSSVEGGSSSAVVGPDGVKPRPSDEHSRPPRSSASTEPLHASSTAHHIPHRYSLHSISSHPHARPSQATTVDRRQSRHSLYSISSRSVEPNPRRSSVVARGAPPHKSNMLIVLPEPLATAPAPAPVSDAPADRSQSQRRSRADLWTETNRRNSYASFQPVLVPEAGNPLPRRRKNSQGSERSIELARSHFVHPEPPPPLPISALTSRAGTPASASGPPPEFLPAPVQNERAVMPNPAPP